MRHTGRLLAALVVVDLGGTYTDASVAGTLGVYTPLAPSRILDTRTVGPIPVRSTCRSPAGAGCRPAVCGPSS